MYISIKYGYTSNIEGGFILKKKEDIVYVVGHKNPDTDSACSAILFANMVNSTKLNEIYIPATLGKINRETCWVLNRWKVPVPKNILHKQVEKIYLVDHNEKQQSVDYDCEIIGICDHHNLNFSYNKVIPVTISPLGSTASIISTTMKGLDYQKTEKDMGLILSAILSDTLGLTSSTTTLTDRIIANTIANKLSINLDSYIVEMFQHSGVSDLSGKKIFYSDLKTYFEAGETFTIGQALVSSDTEEEEIERKIKRFLTTNNIQNNFFMITNIFTKSTLLLTTLNNLDVIQDRFKTDTGKDKNFCSIYLYNNTSRKKDILPEIRQFYLDNKKEACKNECK